MNEHLRDRVLRKLETLSDERGYQVLDYLEFLESKYAQRQAPPANVFARFTEAVEDRLRAGKVSASAIAETVGLMNRAMNVLNGVATGVAAASRSVASDLATATAARTAGQPPPRGAAPTGAAPTGAAPTGGAPTDPTATAGAGGAPVASSTAGRDATPTSQPQSTEDASSGDPRPSESGELDPPLGGDAGPQSHGGVKT
jgi:hypothetical protein